MEKKTIKIKDKELIIMEQPASTVLAWERMHKDSLVGYAKQILTYPNGINPKIEDILDIPDIIKTGELELNIKDNKLDIAETLIRQLDNSTLVYMGEKFIKLCRKNIDDYKYKQIEKIGEEVFYQIQDIAYLGEIVNTFRSF